MKKINIFYWITTGIFALLMTMSGIQNLLVTPEWVEIMKQLGYPVYIIAFLGVAKLIGVIAILVPGFPRLKEWAYAGFFFDLVGATYSGLAVNGFVLPMLGMLIFFLFFGLSYFLYHKRLKGIHNS